MDYDIQTIFNNNFLITQFFGQNLSDYKRFGMKGHNGVDFIPTKNDSWNVQSVSNGVVIEAGFDVGGFGNFIKIKDGDKIWLYAHLSKINVIRHQPVQKGVIIGIMGNTGNSEGAHLHLGLKITDNLGNVLNNNNGYFGAVNPLPFLCKILQKTNSKPQISTVSSVQNIIQTPSKPQFSNPVYQNFVDKGRFDLLDLSINDRDDEVSKLKTQNENLQNQITEIKANSGKDFDQFSKQQDELNAKIKYLEGKKPNFDRINENLPKNNTQITNLSDEVPQNPKISVQNYKNQSNFEKNPVLEVENTLESPIIPIIPVLSTNKKWWESKKFLSLIFSIVLGILSSFAKPEFTQLILTFIGTVEGIYLGGQSLTDSQTAASTQEYINLIQNQIKNLKNTPNA